MGRKASIRAESFKATALDDATAALFDSDGKMKKQVVIVPNIDRNDVFEENGFFAEILIHVSERTKIQRSLMRPIFIRLVENATTKGLRDAVKEISEPILYIKQADYISYQEGFVVVTCPPKALTHYQQMVDWDLYTNFALNNEYRMFAEKQGWPPFDQIFMLGIEDTIRRERIGREGSFITTNTTHILTNDEFTSLKASITQALERFNYKKAIGIINDPYIQTRISAIQLRELKTLFEKAYAAVGYDFNKDI